MSQDADRTLFNVDGDIGSSPRSAALPALKTWVAPKVIVATVDDTETGPGAHSDNSAAS